MYDLTSLAAYLGGQIRSYLYQSLGVKVYSRERRGLRIDAVNL